MARRQKRDDYILPAWVGPVVSGPAFDSDRPQWHRCTGCRREILSTSPMCMSCDPAYVQIQPGVFARKDAQS